MRDENSETEKPSDFPPSSHAKRSFADIPPPSPLTGFLILLSCIVIWGVNTVAFKKCTNPATGIGLEPLFLTGLRFIVVVPCLAVMIGLRQPESLRLPPGDWKKYLVFGFFAIVLAETLQPVALRYTSVANLTLLSHGTMSLFTALWALVLFQQRIPRLGWVGAFIALVGVGVVAANGGSGGFRMDTESLKGDGVALFRSFEHSCYLLYLSRWLQKRPVLQVSFYNCAFGVAFLIPYVIWKSLSFPWAQVSSSVWWWFLWTIGPTTLYGFLAWNWAMRRVGAITASNMYYLMPIAAAVAAYFILGEPLRVGQILGGAVIIFGVLLLRWETLIEAGIKMPEMHLRFWRKG